MSGRAPTTGAPARQSDEQIHEERVMEQHDNHGHSRAAWTGTAIMLVAAAVACWGVFFGPELLLYVGLGAFVVGALVWYLMDRASQGADDEPAHTGRPITPPASARSGQRTEATD
jgi:hypothetical protein